MMSLYKKVNHLKELLETEEDFGLIASTFLDVHEDPLFRQKGKKSKSTFLKEILVQMMETKFPDSVFQIKIQVCLRKFQLYHGLVFFNGRPGNYFYFSDIQMGLLCLTEDMTGRMSYIRFTGAPVEPGGFTVNSHSDATH